MACKSLWMPLDPGLLVTRMSEGCAAGSFAWVEGWSMMAERMVIVV